MLDRLKQIHGINQELCTDNLFKFWNANSKGESYNKSIDASLRVQNETKLINVWNSLTTKLITNIQHSTEPLLLYSTNHDTHECLIGLYIYFLKKTTALPLDKNVKALSSKIAGINYKMTPYMKKIIYATCQ